MLGGIKFMGNKANFKVDPRLANLLGESYRSTENALKELIDNAWDADATAISVMLPAPMTADPIVIEDNGCGMTELDIRNEYLVVARDRRSRKGDRTNNLKRLVKGRKGIGKFAGLMVAGVMETQSSARGKTTTVIISQDDLLNVTRDLERIDLPIVVTATPDSGSGTKVTLTGLNQRYTFPKPEKLKSILILEYGREEGVSITVNGDLLTLEDIPGKRFKHEETIPDAGTMRLDFKVSDGSKPLKQAGLSIRVSGKIIGKPSFFGLEDDPEIPPSLLRKLYGEVEADSLADCITADGYDIVENSTAFQALKPVIQAHLKKALKNVFHSEMNLQLARIQRKVNHRLAKMPKHSRKFAQIAIEKLVKRFLGESDERITTVVNVMLDALEKDEYWQVLKHINDCKGADVETFASALEEFGLLDMVMMANQAQHRLQLLDNLDILIRNPDTLEQSVHKVIEKNIWILGYEYSLVTSNKTLKKTVEDHSNAKFSGKRAAKRPDMLLGQNLRGGHLLIEFKRPSKDITRDDQRQAQEYRDDLEPKFGVGSIEIMMLGRGRDVSVLHQNDPPRMKVFGYEALISSARTELDWLIKELTN
jgi:hypothetical protein